MINFAKAKYLLPLLILGMVVSSGCNTPKKSDETKKPMPKVESKEKNKYKNKDLYLVNVSVADIHAEPGKDSEMVTQSLLADPVELIDISNDEWYKVKVADGYIGYIQKTDVKKVSSDSIYLSNGKRAMLKSTQVPILEAAKSEIEVARAFMGSQLALVKTENDWLQVTLPDNRKGWFKAEDAIVIPKRDSAPKGDSANVVSIAKLFLGTPYLWGGTTSMGVDCSGLSYIAYLLNGVKLPRDADIEYKTGIPIENIADLKEGDLVFFATDVPKPDITHVGIYIGDDKFLHAANRNQGTIISGISEDKYRTTFRGGRRYLK